MKICAVLPCYNVGALCVPVIEQTTEHVDKILALDDGSTDDTPKHLAAAGIATLAHKENAGKGAALITAFNHILDDPEYEEFDSILTIDGDGQHNPQEIPSLIEAYKREPQAVVIGTREIDRPDIQRRRRWGNITSRFFISWACGQYIPDTQSGFRLFSRELLEKVLPGLGPGRYETETSFLILAAREGHKVAPAPISTIYTDEAEQVSSFNPYLDTYLIVKIVAKSILFKK